MSKGLMGYFRSHRLIPEGHRWHFKGGWPRVTDVAQTRVGMDDALIITEFAAIAAVDSAGGLFAWQNPWSVPILVHKLIVRATTLASAACTADFGVAANGTTSSDTLLDGIDLNGGTSPFASTAVLQVDENGGSNDWITGSVATGASAGIVGQIYLAYQKTRS